MKAKHSLFFVLIGLLMFAAVNAHAQSRILSFSGKGNTNTDHPIIRTVNDQGIHGIEVSYRVPGVLTTEKKAGQSSYTVIHLKDFGSLRNVGKPALPVRYDLVVLPEGAKTKLKIASSKPLIFKNILVCPALKPATDRKGDPEPVFETDTAFYQSNDIYPETPVKIVKIIQVKGLDIALIQVCPLQYFPASRTLKAFHELSYSLSFTGTEGFLTGLTPGKAFLEKLSSIVLNAGALKKATAELSIPKAASGPPVNYIILTHNNYLEAADSLAAWKSQLGYSCEIVSAPSWTSAQVKSAIQQRYQSWNPKPDYLVILGDHDLVPGEIHQDPNYGDNFATDLYYVCMDGAGDNIPDMAFGRISVSSSTQAMTVIRKIIHYEKDPPQDALFYRSGVNCANFQDEDSNSFEDRRFSLTEEELRNYMVLQQGFSVTRIYQANSDVTPLYWNNDYYAAGEPVPSALRKPTFAWDGDKYDIRDQINSASGRLFITHRDHGYVGGSGWADPEFTASDINMLNNGNRTPVVFSINCHTGEYQLPECFSEKFLRYPNGGAVGVFGAAYYSYSGYNDGLILGMFDAIWPNPGILPDFTGYADSPTGSPTAHPAIYSMGDVLNQGMLRMMQTWGDDSYTHELFHYFGDPAMQIWTQAPAAITATHTDSLFCGDTSFTIFTSSLANGLATLVVNGQLIASTVLTTGSGVLHFPPLAGTNALLTISGHDYRPYIAEIPIDSSCVRADFSISDSGLCVNKNLTFNSTSEGNINTYFWDFGDGAVPATANTEGPFTVHYSSPGLKTIQLTVTGSSGNHTANAQIEIEQVCSFTMEQNGLTSITGCNGVLEDNGGAAAYASNSNDTAVITAPGATNLQLVFNVFDIESGSTTSACDYDWLSIYDGPTTAATLLGTWCNTAGINPPASLLTSANTFTVVFHSDAYTQMQGFELEWTCATALAPPNPAFTSDKQWSCNGPIHFTDQSMNNPTSWRWEFGDGDTSLLQHPDHVYQQNGQYTVRLTATNAFGSNTYTRTEYITIDRPTAPVALNDHICNSGTATLEATGSGTIYWYDAPTGGTQLDSGSTFTTPLLAATTSYFAEDRISELFTLAPADSAQGNGAFYTGTSNHYLRFDAFTDITLVSVKVYAQNSATRKISLRNSSGSVLHDTTMTINAGMQRINLNFPVPEGTGYRLQCDSVNHLYRNAGGASFPYTVPQVISITGNSYSNQDYYYFFYDWEVLRSACISPRAAVIAQVDSANPVATFTYSLHTNIFEFSDQSSNAANWLWDFGDGTQSTLQNPEHTYSTYGTYFVNLIVSNDCGSSTKTDTIDYYTVGVGEHGDTPLFSLQPNPARDIVTLYMQNGYEGMITIEMRDITGRKIASFVKHHTYGNSYPLNTANLPGGVYVVSLKAGERQAFVRLIKY